MSRARFIPIVFSLPALVLAQVVNGDFEARAGWLINSKQPGAPAYAPGEGASATTGFRVGFFNGQPGASSAAVAQAFSAMGTKKYTRVTFWAKFLQEDGEVAEFYVGSARAPNKVAMPTVTPGDVFMPHTFSMEDCDHLIWVEFHVRHETQASTIPGIQSTLFLDDVSCECTDEWQNSWDQWQFLLAFPGFPPPEEGKTWFYPSSAFRRGDANASGKLTIADVIGILEYLFLDAAAPACPDAADANDDGAVNLADPVGILYFLFRGAPAPPPPGPGGCGIDPTPDGMRCTDLAPCQ